jgi:uncharacterized RDD family membrane protein YckC
LPLQDLPELEPAASVEKQEPPVEVHARPAGLFSRAIALLVDGIVLGALMAGYFLVARAIVGAPAAPDDIAAPAWRGILVPGLALLAALAFVYSTLFHALGGRTLGKRLLGIVLLDASGRPPRLARSAVRAALVPLSFAPLLLGVLMALFDRNKQSLHDKLTRTFVVRLGQGRG